MIAQHSVNRRPAASPVTDALIPLCHPSLGRSAPTFLTVIWPPFDQHESTLGHRTTSFGSLSVSPRSPRQLCGKKAPHLTTV